MENPERVTYFAATDARGKFVPFGIKSKDRDRHMYVIGKTGMGKSTLLENMAIQDIRNGEGLAFIDPHGGTIDRLLDFIPENRVKDVVYFAPFDLAHPVAFNVMEDVGYDRRHLVVSGLMATFKKIWEDAWSARMEYILTNTLLALLEYPDATLLGVNRMYTDKDYRKKVVDNVKDPVVKDFWTKEFANYGDRYTQEATPAIQNKVGQFTGNPLIRNIIGQPKSSFDIRAMMDDRKILLINLSKGLIGETNMRLLGSMFTTRIFLSAMSRANLHANELRQMPHFYFYVDEFQNFANQTFAEILSESRKYKLNLTIAHQYIEQMEEPVRDAVFGNVGTTVVFRVGPMDAEVLEPIFMPRFTKEDIASLDRRQMYLSLMIDGVGSQPFSAVSIPPIEMPPVSFREKVIEESRQKYSTPRADVEKKIMDELTQSLESEAPQDARMRRRPQDQGQRRDQRPQGPRMDARPREQGRPPEERRFVPPVSAPSEPIAEASQEPAPPRSDIRPERGPEPPRIPEQRDQRRNEQRPPQQQSHPRDRERDMRPRQQQQGAQPQKSPADLRAILRDMTEKHGALRAKEQEKRETSLKGAIAQVAPPIQQAQSAQPQPQPQPQPITPPPPVAPQNGKAPYEVPEDELRRILKGES